MSSSSLVADAGMARPVCEAGHGTASCGRGAGGTPAAGVSLRSRIGDEAARLGKRVGTIARDRPRPDRHALREQILERVVVDRDRLGGRLARALEAGVARVGSLAAAVARAELGSLVARRAGLLRRG